jgi:hypothetical protein
MKILKITILLMFFFASSGYSQLKHISKENLVSESEIYINENDVIYSNLINIKFSRNVLNPPLGQKICSILDVNDSKANNFLTKFRTSMGLCHFINWCPMQTGMKILR